MIGCLGTRVRKQPIIALYFESETVLQFYNLEVWSKYGCLRNMTIVTRLIPVILFILNVCEMTQLINISCFM